MGCRTLKAQPHKGFEILGAAIWIFVFGVLAILTQKFLVERQENFDPAKRNSLASIQEELQREHLQANRRWRSDDPRNKRWKRQATIRKSRHGKSSVKHSVAFDSSPP